MNSTNKITIDTSVVDCIDWTINESPYWACINSEFHTVPFHTEGYEEGEKIPLSVFGDMVVARESFSLWIPTSRWGDLWDTITIQALDGIVTVESLLRQIYDRYQKPLNPDERAKYRDYCKVWGSYAEDSVLGDSIGCLIYFEGIDRRPDGTYELALGS